MEYIIDAKDKKFGRVASEVAQILQGKKTPYYDPRLAGQGDVIVKNLSKVVFSGNNKMENKIYYRHTGYMGHLKEKSLKQSLEDSPSRVFKLAVMRMLPKNYLRVKRMKRLTIEE